MGLDMYLNRKLFIGEQYDHRNVKAKLEITYKGLPIKIDDKISEVVMEGVYWRKANAIHNWFVEKVQNGTDDCKPYEVSVEELEALYRTVSDVLDHKGDEDYAEEHLPTTSGFFFGSTNYGKWYWEDLEYTKERIKAELDWANSQPDIFYPSWEYQSSW